MSNDNRERCDGPCGRLVDPDTMVADSTDRNERDAIALCVDCPGPEPEPLTHCSGCGTELDGSYCPECEPPERLAAHWAGFTSENRRSH